MFIFCTFVKIIYAAEKVAAEVKMVKGIRFIKSLIIAVTVITLFLMVYGFYTVPDEIYGISDVLYDLGLK